MNQLPEAEQTLEGPPAGVLESVDVEVALAAIAEAVLPVATLVPEGPGEAEGAGLEAEGTPVAERSCVYALPRAIWF